VSLPESLAVPLRRGDPAVVGRLEQGRLLLDLRSVSPADDERLTDAVLAAAGTELS
jgi:L-seryl-tRNA(Ser) seleniumtransferase